MDPNIKMEVLCSDLCSVYREVYQRAYRKLLVTLPIEKFVRYLSDKTSLNFAKVNDGDLDEEERPRGICRETLLELVREDLKVGKVSSFNQLLEAMGMYVDVENDIVIDRILNTMKKEIEGASNSLLCHVCVQFMCSCKLPGFN